MLRDVVQRGTAVRAKALGRGDIAGKTGTTNDQKDAWFSGFNDQVVTTAWVGFDNQKPLGSRETGGRAALPMWIDYMRDALQGLPVNLEEQPEDMITVRIDEETGQRASDSSRSTRFEIFTVGTAPEEIKQHTGGGNRLVDQNVPSAGNDIAEEIF
jgi:penicillin-binding protein 1A